MAEAVCEEVLSIPIHPYLSSTEVERIVDVLRAVFSTDLAIL